MDLSKIPAGRNPPTDVNALIEIPAGGQPVKYELDKESGALFVDRFLHTAIVPCSLAPSFTLVRSTVPLGVLPDCLDVRCGVER